MENVLIHLKISKVDFNCPKCGKEYSDEDDKYLNRCEKNKNFRTNIKCKCGNSFYMTYNYMGNAVSFEKESKYYL
jgi:predicted RNA-binding Zn-ribbon protein involved in translation (DUF1610 family)